MGESSKTLALGVVGSMDSQAGRSRDVLERHDKKRKRGVVWAKEGRRIALTVELNDSVKGGANLVF